MYYVEGEVGARKQRPHTIQVNMEKDATARDVFESYYFARLLDRNRSDRLVACQADVEAAIRKTGWQF